MEPQFEWDNDKARTNLEKHKVSFAEAVTVFHDPLVASMPDLDHPGGEERFIAIGLSASGRLLIVIYTERGGRTRIISCRKATRTERRIYEQNEF